MIDLRDLRERAEAYQEACKNKGITFDVKAFLDLDKSYRELKTELEQLRSEQNRANKEIGAAAAEDREVRLAEMKELSTRVKDASAKFKEIEAQWKSDQLHIASIPLEKVPVGKDDSENVLVRTEGQLPDFNFEPRDHVAIGKALDIIDLERGVKIAGARNYFLKGDGARLQHAILSLAMDLLHKKGYLIFDPPHLVKWEAMMGTSYFPGGEEMAYHLDERDEGVYLIGTSEVSVCAYHEDEILTEEELPKRYAGYSPCYRREAGTYGKDTHGLYRIHQFYKVEQVVVCKNDPAESSAIHSELLANAEEMLRLLELPYQVVDVCTGDIGQGQVYKNDIETWMPSRNSYGETHSCSTFYDFQARRLKLRYTTADGERQFCHTLNNTLVASPRILIPMLEIHQQADGTVRIPEALQPYMGGQVVITPR